MKIKNIHIENEGYVYCRSKFYSVQDILPCGASYDFAMGKNELTGEIDSGVWAASYLLSMYGVNKQDFILFQPPQVTVNGTHLSLEALSAYTCYMDEMYPLFSDESKVNTLVTRELEKSKLKYTSMEVKDLFQVENERFERPLAGVGNEIFRAMAAIGFAANKQVFCFPWLSKMRFGSYHGHLLNVLDILESLGKMIVLPTGK